MFGWAVAVISYLFNVLFYDLCLLSVGFSILSLSIIVDMILHDTFVAYYYFIVFAMLAVCVNKFEGNRIIPK